MSNTNLTQLLQALMTGLNEALDQETTSQDISVASTENIEESSVKVFLQGSVKTPGVDTFRSYVANGYTFRNLLSTMFPDSDASRIVSVSVSEDGDASTYALDNRIPGALLDAIEVRISYAVESGRNG